MTLPEAILAVLLASPPWHEDQNESGRVERLTVISLAIADASEQDTRRAALVTMAGLWESRFNRRVHAGECGRDECDPVSHGRGVRHTSITPWQLKQNRMPREQWLSMVGLELEPTTRAARESNRRLEIGLKRCGSVKGAISMYAIGKCDGYYQAEMRLASYQKIKSGIERRLNEQ
jgi:hypothetical protein